MSAGRSKQIFGSDTTYFTKKAIDCSLGRLITKDAIDRRSGLLKTESTRWIRKKHLWSYLMYLWEHNHLEARHVFYGITKGRVTEHLLEKIKDFLIKRESESPKLNRSGQQITYVTIDQLIQFVNDLISTSSWIVNPLTIEDSSSLSSTSNHKKDMIMANLLDRKIAKQSKVIDELLEDIHNKRNKPAKIKLEIVKGSEYVHDMGVFRR
jgi:hypothetical protein